MKTIRVNAATKSSSWIAVCSVVGPARKLRRICTVCTIVLPPVGAGAASFVENPPLPVPRPAVLVDHQTSVGLSGHGPANTAEGEAGATDSGPTREAYRVSSGVPLETIRRNASRCQSGRRPDHSRMVSMTVLGRGHGTTKD
jgi:hypothetical protein